MANTRNTDFTLVDYTKEINLYPKIWSLVSGMNLFQDYPLTGDIAQIEVVTSALAMPEARLRGGDRNFIGKESAVTKNLNTAFYPLDRNLKAADYLNFRAYGTGETTKSVMTDIDRIMTSIRGSHAQLKEFGQAKAIQGVGINGAGLGVDYNYYTEFNRTQAFAPVDFTDLETNPADTIEKLVRRPIIRSAQDGTDSHAVYRIGGYCGEDYFSAFISHPEVEEAYKYFAAGNDADLLRKRLGMNSEDDSVRVFKYKSLTLIEDLSGNFEATEAWWLPLNMPDMFRNYISPADDLENSDGSEGTQDLYLWYKENKFDRKYKVESECAFLCVNLRPELCIQSVGTY